MIVLRSSQRMKALEFESWLADGDKIQLPQEVAKQIPEGSAARVILLLEPEDEANWRRLSAERFADAYAEEDAVYEKLIDGPAIR